MERGGQRLAELAAEAAHAASPRAALRRLGDLRRELDAFERRQVARALADGATFAAIARDLGISRQAVHRRFRDLASKELTLGTAPDVPRVLQYAREEAASVGAEELASEHLLLAVLRAGDLPAAEPLLAAGVGLERARLRVEGTSPGVRLFGRRPAVDDLRALLEAPARAVRARGGGRIEVEDLLIAALEDTGGGAARTLRALGVEPETIRDELGRLVSRTSVRDAAPRAAATAAPGG